MQDAKRLRHLIKADDGGITPAVLEIGEVLLGEPGGQDELFLSHLPLLPKPAHLAPHQSPHVYALSVGLSLACAKHRHVTITDDRFSKEATLLGPMVMINPFGGTERDWRLRSWVDKKSDAAHTQLYSKVTYIADGRCF